ncbi:MAG: hypothetical protein GC152_09750 [Alphaproteobacteria bacterium]|nr:hypothetical protein [Alphaproteobacteria bacterium]
MLRIAMTAAISLLLIVAATTDARAQNLGGVFPPMPGSKELEYRFAVRPGEGAAPAMFAHRLHYQQNVAERLLVRGIAVVSHAEATGPQFNYAQAELFWDVGPSQGPWRTALRFDARISEGSAPEQFAVNWANEFRFTDSVRARFNVLMTKQVGDLAVDGILIETRSNLFKQTSTGFAFGVESYNVHGSTAAFDLYGGRQQIGPFAFIPLGGDFTAFAGALFGANGASPDVDVRFWLRKNF